MVSTESMVNSHVSPLGSALATAAAPMLPPAPPLFSTTTVRSSRAHNFSAITRASASVGPPAASGTMSVTLPGGSGSDWARDACDGSTPA